MWTRRAFLKAGGLALFSLSLGGTPLFLTRAARAAQGPAGRRVLVALFQRGAMDGLMAVAPRGDRYLARARPRLGMEQELLDLDSRFGLHPALEPLLPLFREGRLAVVHGVGSPDPTRSHFDAQDYMETGTPGRKGTSSGWLNRAVGLLGHEGTPLRQVALTSALPRSMYGEEPALAISDLERFEVQSAGARQSLEALYSRATRDLLAQAGRETFEAVKVLRRLRHRRCGGTGYPDSPLGRSLRQIAELIRAEVGLEVAFAESGGWDTHVAQGTTRGTFARRARDLAHSLAAFWKDLGEHYQERVAVLTMTEFGRTVKENGSGGTDHGRASCLFVLGNRVEGGKVHGTVPLLAPENLEDGRDLPVTTDFRAVFAELAGAHLGVADPVALFPGWSGRRMRLVRG